MKKSKVLFVCLIVLVTQACCSVEPFKTGERVVFLGDSITHYGKWWPYVWCGYAAQSPEVMPLFISAGFSGDTATGALKRLERDVFSKEPDTVCVMFGMNDVNRRRYTAEKTAADREGQKKALQTYEQSLDALLAQITERGLRCIVVTPSPYDQTMVNPEAGSLNPGCNDGLALAARIAIKLAQKHGCEVVDFHGPMTRINAEKQAKNPAATIIGPDRIHPGIEGSKIMAKLFLEAQGVDTAGLESAERFKAVWAHVDLERNLRNIVWLEDRVLGPNGIDTTDVEASRTYIREQYPHTIGNKIRADSYFKWRGNEEQLCRELEAIEGRLREPDDRVVE